jgi:ATPase family associated with various cellular activities (AAA)
LSPSLPLNKTVQTVESSPRRQVIKTHDGFNWFVAGKPGTGKTLLIKNIVAKMRSIHPELNLYIVDTKQIGDYTSHYAPIVAGDKHPDPLLGAGQRLIWQPETDNKDGYNFFFKSILRSKKPAIVVLDEAANFKFGAEAPRELEILLKQGRAAGIHVLSGTQEVARCPRQMLSQARYVVSFNLLNRYDKSAMKEYLALPPKEDLELSGHQFWYRDTNDGKPARKFKSYELLLPLVS